MSSKSSTTFRVSDKKSSNLYFCAQRVNMSIKEKISELRLYTENKCTEIIQMSNFPSNVHFSDNGLVNTVVDAYNQHHNLVLRPDDIWAAIMTQFAFYVNKHAEEFRGKFVSFEGKMEVTIPGSMRSVPEDLFVKLMTKKIEEHLIDPEVKNWILPNFSTTSATDHVTIGVLFMATMKKYFRDGCILQCGIPSVTLEGTTEDWKSVHDKIKKLREYKLDKWYDMLEPILQQFVDAKQGNVDLHFWQRIVHYNFGSGSPDISGWITAFCAFDENGNWRGESHKNDQWLIVHTKDIPSGIMELEVKIKDNETEFKSLMFAGHMGVEIKKMSDTVKPVLGWAIALYRPNITPIKPPRKRIHLRNN